MKFLKLGFELAVFVLERDEFKVSICKKLVRCFELSRKLIMVKHRFVDVGLIHTWSEAVLAGGILSQHRCVDIFELLLQLFNSGLKLFFVLTELQNLVGLTGQLALQILDFAILIDHRAHHQIR